MRLISILILIIYCTVLVKVLVFKDLPVIRLGSLKLRFGGTHSGPSNLVPFRTIMPYLTGDRGMMIAAINLVGNIALLVPLGLLFPVAYPNMTWKKALVLSVAAGGVIEGMQAILQVGILPACLR